MATVLITGSNRGIGKRLAQLYAASGASVIATMRNPSDAPEFSSNVETFALDVTDLVSISALKRQLQARSIDILINNAGIFGPRGMSVGTVDHKAWGAVFEANVKGPAAVSEALLDNLRFGNSRKIATISSRMGSIEANISGGEMIYRSSKSAVNAVMRCFAQELAKEQFTIFNLHPGWVQTDMGGPNAAIDVNESAVGLKQVIDAAGSDANGGFFNYDGTSIPW